MSSPKHRPSKHTDACKRYRNEGRREKNRDRRVARIRRGFQKKADS